MRYLSTLQNIETMLWTVKYQDDNGSIKRTTFMKRKAANLFALAIYESQEDTPLDNIIIDTDDLIYGE